MAAVALKNQLNAHIASMFAAGFLDKQFQELQMLQDDGSSPGFVSEVVGLFIDDAEKITGLIAGLLDQPVVDFDKVDALVHQLKGSSASVGAQRVKLSCEQFHSYYEAKNRDGCVMALALLRNEFYDSRSKFQTMFQKYCLVPGAISLTSSECPILPLNVSVTVLFWSSKSRHAPKQ
ncbi:hypothetical protein ACQ4PT_021313 [Festuca glaucescens]